MNIAKKISEDLNAVNASNFLEYAIELFHFQYLNNPIYKKYCDLLKIDVKAVQSLEQIPFLPIQQFKQSTIQTTPFKAEAIFSSSGTSSSSTSQHHVKEIELYEQSFSLCFEKFYGNIEEYCVLALLPSYLERKGSSLIYMVDHLIKRSQHESSGFYLYNFEELKQKLLSLKAQRQKTLLLGVSFALLDFVETFQISDFNELIVMETGGMKGQRKEIIRSELHALLKAGLGVKEIHSEYGMTELLSQAYSIDGRFYCPPWMKVMCRSVDDPFEYVQDKTGGVNVIDLANVYSSAFIQTDDLGKCYSDGSFEVLGRFDQSEIRGCNLMVT